MDKYNESLIKAYDSYADKIYRHCFYRTFNNETAEELTQETFLRYFKYLKAGKEIEYPKTFLFKIANNLIIDKSRKKKEVSLDSMVENGFMPEDTKHISAETKADVNLALKAIKKIDYKYRLPLIMYYVDGLKPKEIAEILRENTNVISVRIYRGLKKAKKML